MEQKEQISQSPKRVSVPVLVKEGKNSSSGGTSSGGSSGPNASNGAAGGPSSGGHGIEVDSPCSSPENKPLGLAGSVSSLGPSKMGGVHHPSASSVAAATVDAATAAAGLYGAGLGQPGVYPSLAGGGYLMGGRGW